MTLDDFPAGAAAAAAAVVGSCVCGGESGDGMAYLIVGECRVTGEWCSGRARGDGVALTFGRGCRGGDDCGVG